MRTYTVREYGTLRPSDGKDDPSLADIEALLDAAARAGRRLAMPGEDRAEAADDRVLRPARGNGLRARGMVGVVVAGDVALEILPKIDWADEDQNRTQLVHMIHDALGLRLDLSPGAPIATQDRTLLDAVIAAFVTRLEEAVRGGLARRYQTVNDDLAVLRGRLDVRRQYTALLTSPGRIACTFDELLIDTALNRCLKATLQLLHSHARSNGLRRSIVTLLNAFEGVRDRAHDFAAARRTLDRTNRRFRDLLVLAELFMNGAYQSTTRGPAGGLALLFDMPTLFERAIATAMRRALGPDAQVKVEPQSHLMQGNAYVLKPDIVIHRPDLPPLVIDTKWKHLIDKPSSADAYQMLAYSHRFGARDCVLLYPGQETCITATWKGHALSGSHQNSEWLLHQAHVPLQDYRDVPRALRSLIEKTARSSAPITASP